MRHGRPESKLARALEQISLRATVWTGSSTAFIVAALIIVGWLASGPLFGFSDTWQLVVNTGTTIVTFLMVFLIQRAQNKESLAVQLKLNELVASIKGASNQLIDVESLSEAELKVLHEHYVQLALMAKQQIALHQSHSLQEAKARHEDKAGLAAAHRRRHDGGPV